MNDRRTPLFVSNTFLKKCFRQVYDVVVLFRQLFCKGTQCDVLVLSLPLLALSMVFSPIPTFSLLHFHRLELLPSFQVL